MALTHINQDLRQALLTHGYGFDNDWKCIGSTVNECSKEQYNWYERYVARTFHNVRVANELAGIAPGCWR